MTTHFIPGSSAELRAESSLPYETLLVERRAGIGVMTLNRPTVLNAINNRMIDEIRHAIADLHDDPDIGVLVITGAGRAFQSGADLKELSEMSPLEILRWNQRLIENLDALVHIRQPVIAAINGPALGGGLELALACSIRIASESAKFGLPEVKVGILPGAGGTQRLPRLIGKGRAAEIILTGETIGATEAYRIGLLNHIVPDDQVMVAAEALGRRILHNAPIAVALAKDAIEVGEDLPIEAAIQYAQKNCAICFATKDLKEGTAAFFEKRKPIFRGR